jgi:hypothetical protein
VNASPLRLHKTRQRISSRGYEPLLQGKGLPGNPGADMLAAGLRVPYNPTGQDTDEPPNTTQRYLCQLCSIGIGDGLLLTGLGQLSMLGSEQQVGGVPPTFPNILEQTTANFRFSDCLPIRWGVRRVRKPNPQWTGMNPLSTNSFAWRWTDTSALIYETAKFTIGNLDWKGTPDNYLQLLAYTAPGGGGVFPGEPVGGDLGCFDSLDFPWSGGGKKVLEPVWVKPGGYLVFYALVDQSNPATRAKIQVPGQFPLPTTGMPENAFVGDFTLSNQYSVGGWLEVEQP